MAGRAEALGVGGRNRQTATMVRPRARFCILGLLLACRCGPAEPVENWTYAAWDGGPAWDLPRPLLPLPAGDLGLTSDTLGDTVTFYDLAARKVLARLPVGRNPIDIDGPHHLGLDRARGLLYVALSYPAPTLAAGPHARHGASQRAGWVQQWSLRPFAWLAESFVAPNPGDIVVSEDGGRVVVTHFDLARVLRAKTLVEMRAPLALFEPQGPAQLGAAREVPMCVAPHGVVLDGPSASRAWVACYGEDAVAVVDLAGTLAVERVPLAAVVGPAGAPLFGPYALQRSASGDRLAVACSVSKDVRVFDTSARKMQPGAVPVGGVPLFPAWAQAGDRLWVPVQAPDSLQVIDMTGRTIAKQRTFAAGQCPAPHEVVWSSDRTTLWLVCEGDHVAPGKLLAIDPESLATLGEIEAGIYPDRLLVMPALASTP